MRRLFRVVSCYELDRCVSYSTLDKAENKLYELASEHGHEIVKTYNNHPEDYDWYNGYHPVKTWHEYITKEGHCYTIVEFNNKREVSNKDIDDYCCFLNDMGDGCYWRSEADNRIYYAEEFDDDDLAINPVDVTNRIIAEVEDLNEKLALTKLFLK